MTLKTQEPAVEGMYVIKDGLPYLVGSKGAGRGSYFFPKDLAGSDPTDSSLLASGREEVLLSRVGKVWSYTTASYPPPPPFVITKEPWEPYVLAAVELPEKIVVLGAMTNDVTLKDMKIGMEVELVLDTLFEDEAKEYISWKWKPANK